jgi:hypothetical protein
VHVEIWWCTVHVFLIGIGVWLLLVCVQISARKCYKGEKPGVSFTFGQREEAKSETILSPLPICESAAKGVMLTISESATTQFSSTIFVPAANQSRCWIVLPASSQLSLLNCVVCNESVFVAELCCLQLISSRAQNCSEPVLAAKLCCLQWVSFFCRIVVQQQISFCCRIVLSTASQFSLPNSGVCDESVFTIELCRPQRICFHCRIVLSIANLVSLPNCVTCSKPTFALELCWRRPINFCCRIVWPATN